ncbi:hypothetical protein Hypma_003784 [Hypsizygus marmoreus]|uniref:Uncharacterized protein n=1 Tax=Hypsizygus marmoreus TaxID=39966 RepID=A0A369K1Z8_HYPMA|nr:hypothetical protein Hypma_003784 [Hypsizygus marmoreus]
MNGYERLVERSTSFLIASRLIFTGPSVLIPPLSTTHASMHYLSRIHLPFLSYQFNQINRESHMPIHTLPSRRRSVNLKSICRSSHYGLRSSFHSMTAAYIPSQETNAKGPYLPFVSLLVKILDPTLTPRAVLLPHRGYMYHHRVLRLQNLISAIRCSSSRSLSGLTGRWLRTL